MSNRKVLLADQISEKNKMFALKRYETVISVIQNELMVSGSDDFTMFLWNPSQEKKPIARYKKPLFLLTQSSIINLVPDSLGTNNW